MALIDDFKIRFPEFEQSVVDQYIPILADVYPCYYGGDYDVACDKEAILNLLAHLLIFESNGSDASPKFSTSVSVGDVSESYATKDSTGWDVDMFGSTKYGARFLYLTASNLGGYFV